MTSQNSFITIPRCKNNSWKYPSLPQPFVHYVHLTLQSIRSLLSGNIPFLIRLGRLFFSARNSNFESKQHLSRHCWVLPNRIFQRLSIPYLLRYLYLSQLLRRISFLLRIGKTALRPQDTILQKPVQSLDTWILCLPLLLGSVHPSCN